jgi:hypothetical protein
MARTKTFSIAFPPDQLKNQIDSWASEKQVVSASEEERNIAFLRSMCYQFQTRMEAYYKAGKDEDRLRRLDEICQALIEIAFTDGEKTFTIAAPYQPTPESWEDVAVGVGCEPGERCTRGACM